MVWFSLCCLRCRHRRHDGGGRQFSRLLWDDARARKRGEWEGEGRARLETRSLPLSSLPSAIEILDARTFAFVAPRSSCCFTADIVRRCGLNVTESVEPNNQCIQPSKGTRTEQMISAVVGALPSSCHDVALKQHYYTIIPPTNFSCCCFFRPSVGEGEGLLQDRQLGGHPAAAVSHRRLPGTLLRVEEGKKEVECKVTSPI